MSDNLLAEVVTEIRKLWPECRIVTETPVVRNPMEVLSESKKISHTDYGLF